MRRKLQEPDIPLVYDVPDPVLKRHLERMGNAMRQFFGQVRDNYERTPEISDARLAFGAITKVDPFPSGVALSLPRASAVDDGKTTSVLITSPTGVVQLSAHGADILGTGIYRCPTAVGLHSFTYVGGEFWVNR